MDLSWLVVETTNRARACSIQFSKFCLSAASFFCIEFHTALCCTNFLVTLRPVRRASLHSVLARACPSSSSLILSSSNPISTPIFTHLSILAPDTTPHCIAFGFVSFGIVCSGSITGIVFAVHPPCSRLLCFASSLPSSAIFLPWLRLTSRRITFQHLYPYDIQLTRFATFASSLYRHFRDIWLFLVHLRDCQSDTKTTSRSSNNKPIQQASTSCLRTS